jgi:hypothetical protein
VRTVVDYGAHMDETTMPWATPRLTALNVSLDTAGIKVGSTADQTGSTNQFI